MNYKVEFSKYYATTDKVVNCKTMKEACNKAKELIIEELERTGKYLYKGEEFGKYLLDKKNQKTILREVFENVFVFEGQDAIKLVFELMGSRSLRKRNFESNIKASIIIEE